MRTSTMIFLTDESITPVRLARALEERGFAGLYVPEHSHMPIERLSQYPPGGELPDMYYRTLDPFVALAQAAAVTERLTVGTGITLVAQNNPHYLAKRIATLDHLSGGRFTFGVGFGWNREESEDHNVVWSTRRELVLEKMRLMRALWAPEPTAYQGEFGLSVRASAANPKPVRGGAPRTLVGGGVGPKSIAHMVEYADGWMPDGGADLAGNVPRLRRAWEEAGRDPGALQIVPYGVVPTAERIAEFQEFGVEEMILALPSAGEDEVLRALDAYARYV